jgi:hypothetical protein
MARAVGKSSQKKSDKTKSQLSGTFQNQARRARMISPKTLGRGAARCSSCGAVYFDKHWHTCADTKCRLKAIGGSERLCDECRLKTKVIGSRDSDYAGEVVIEGLKDPTEKYEVRRLAERVGKRAVSRDPEDRIVSVSETGGKLVVRTSENQLAVSIGKQIDRARKGGKLEIAWSKVDKMVRVRWKAK